MIYNWLTSGINVKQYLGFMEINDSGFFIRWREESKEVERNLKYHNTKQYKSKLPKVNESGFIHLLAYQISPLQKSLWLTVKFIDEVLEKLFVTPTASISRANMQANTSITLYPERVSGSIFNTTFPKC